MQNKLCSLKNLLLWRHTDLKTQLYTQNVPVGKVTQLYGVLPLTVFCLEGFEYGFKAPHPFFLSHVWKRADLLSELLQ